MKRRNFVLLAGIGIAGAAIPTWYFKYRTPAYYSELAEPLGLAQIWDDSTIISMGNLYREKFPREDSENKLVRLLLQDSSSKQGSLGLKIPKSENVVILDGWILSKTEARQCALLSMKLLKP